MFNSHVHSQFSSDCKFDGKTMCTAALEKGLSGIAFTDHCCLDSYISENSYRKAILSAQYINELKREYKGRLSVSSGIEMGEALRRPDYAQRIIEAARFDVVLMSVHRVVYDNLPRNLAKMNFSSFSDEKIKKIIAEYFCEIEHSIYETDFDVCAHLTLPLRYICGVYKRTVDISEYYGKIKKILAALIKHGKALELNTGDLYRQLYDFMPDKKILNMYREMGGRLVTVGSDAHSPEYIDMGLMEGVKLLKSCGFTEYCFYRERKPVMISI